MRWTHRVLLKDVSLQHAAKAANVDIWVSCISLPSEFETVSQEEIVEVLKPDVDPQFVYRGWSPNSKPLPNYHQSLLRTVIEARFFP